MTRRGSTSKAEVFRWAPNSEGDTIERLRYAAASKLLTWREHHAGAGSAYVTVGESLKLRFADHANLSPQYPTPDYSFVSRRPTEVEIAEIVARIEYPQFCRQTAFAKHVGLTVPKLGKLLPTSCFEELCENYAYPNTLTNYVRVDAAFSVLEEAGYHDRIAIRQERYTWEDYAGF